MTTRRGPGLLIASPQMKDPNFGGTLVLLCHQDDQGALGVVINRETSLTVSEVVSQMDVDTDRDLDEQVLWGGPVEQAAGFVVFPGSVTKENGWSINPGLSVSPSRETLEGVLRGEEPYHLCLGYAGWGPGQLENEISTGSWLYIDVDARIVLEHPVGDRYDLALQQLGVPADQIWMIPIDE